jgi:DNA repair protein RadC
VRTGLRGTNALDIGKQLVCKFGSLGAMARASVDDLQCIRGIGRDKAVTLVAAFTLGSKIAEELQRESPVLDNPEAIAGLLREQNRLKQVETFQILMLNTRRRLIRVEQVSQGLLDTILVHPREVFQSAISARAAAIVLVHNHPSGEGYVEGVKRALDESMPLKKGSSGVIQIHHSTSRRLFDE